MNSGKKILISRRASSRKTSETASAVLKLSTVLLLIQAPSHEWTKITIIYNNLRNVYQKRDIQPWSESLKSVKFEYSRRALIVHLHLTVVKVLPKTLITISQTLCQSYSGQELYQRSLAVAAVWVEYVEIIAGQFHSQEQNILALDSSSEFLRPLWFFVARKDSSRRRLSSKILFDGFLERTELLALAGVEYLFLVGQKRDWRKTRSSSVVL